MTEPTPVKTSRAPRRGILRRRSLLWVLPERSARILSWTAVLVCLASVATVVMVLRPEPVVRHEGALSAALSTHLAMPVQVKSARLEESGAYTFTDIVVGEKGSVLRGASGNYTPPRDDTPGRLSLRGGVLAVDLDAWMKGRTHPTAFMLDAARRRTGLWRVTLADFTVEFRLVSAGSLVLAHVSGGARLTDEGGLRAELSGTVAGVESRITFEVTDDGQKFTVAGVSLPWVGVLLAPAVGEDVAGLLDAPDGTLELISTTPSAGRERFNWKTEFASTFSLDGLPTALGLGRSSGRLAVSLQAIGRFRESATCYVEIGLAENAKLSVSSAALRNLRYLLTGEWVAPEGDDTDHVVTAVGLSLFITPRYVILAGAADGPAGLFTAAGRNLLPLVPDRIPLVDFRDRLKTLRQLWQQTHAG